MRTYLAAIIGWARRRVRWAFYTANGVIDPAEDVLAHHRSPRRYAFRLRAIRAAFAHEYATWDVRRWMAD